MANVKDMNELFGVLVHNLKVRQIEIKQLKEQNFLLEQRLKEHTTTLERSRGTDISDQCVPTYVPKKTSQEDNKCSCCRKQSNPDVFNFPEPKSESGSGCDRSDYRDTDCVNNKEDIEAVWNLIDNSKAPALVPEKDFKSAIHELIRTKTLLHNLQNSQSDVNVIKKLRDKLEKSEERNEYLERHVKKMETEKIHHQQQMAKLKLGQNELNTTVEPSSQMASSAMLTKLKAEIEELRLRNQTLVEKQKKTEMEKQTLLKENKRLQTEISRCKENENILNTSLEETKERCIKASGSLASLRQQYEELNVEKNALEKELNLLRGRDYKPNTGSRANASDAQQRNPSTKDGYNIMPDLRFSHALDQNNLSPRITERKRSNLSQTSTDKCPRCYAEFFDDVDAYMDHLYRCLNYD